MRTGALLALLLAAPVPALATECVRLEYTREAGAESCAERAAFEAEVVSRLQGHEPWDDSSPTVVRVTFRRKDSFFEGVVEHLEEGALVGARSARSKGLDCHFLERELAQAVKYIVQPINDPELTTCPAATPTPPVPPAPSAFVWPRVVELDKPYVGQKTIREILVRNDGTAVLTVARATLHTESAAFTLDGTPLPAFLPPGGQVILVVGVRPGEEGLLTADLEIETNDPRGEFSRVSLRGIAVPVPGPIHGVTPPAPPKIGVFAGSEGGYSFRTGGSAGVDRYYQSLVWSGSFAAGGTTELAKGYELDVLVTGYSASRRDTRFVAGDVRSETTVMTESNHRLVRFVNSRTSATAVRAMVKWTGEEASASLGVLAGGVQRKGCGINFRFGNDDCDSLNQWLAVPAFSVRMGPPRGPYATLGFLDDRFLSTGLAHAGAGMVFRDNTRLDVSFVAAVEGLGARAELVIPWKGTYLIMPTVAAGNVYDRYLGLTSRSSWVRVGLSVGLARF